VLFRCFFLDSTVAGNEAGLRSQDIGLRDSYETELKRREYSEEIQDCGNNDELWSSIRVIFPTTVILVCHPRELGEQATNNQKPATGNQQPATKNNDPPTLQTF